MDTSPKDRTDYTEITSSSIQEYSSSDTSHHLVAGYDNLSFEMTKVDQRQEDIDVLIKEVAFFEDQIKELSIFIQQNFEYEICGSAVETAIVVMKKQIPETTEEKVANWMAAQICEKIDKTIIDEVVDSARNDSYNNAMKGVYRG